MNAINIMDYCKGFDDSGFYADGYCPQIKVNTNVHQTQWTNITLESFFTQLKQWFNNIDIPTNQEERYTIKFDKFCRSLQAIMQNNQYPADVFDELGFGSYKEVFDFGFPGWVLKFASESNPTIDELNGIADAQNNNLSYLLPKTYYFALPYSVPLSLLEQEFIPNYDESRLSVFGAWMDQKANYIIIQEEGKTILDYIEDQSIPLEDTILDMTNIKICNEYFKAEEISQLLYIDCTWITLLMEKFGKDAVIKFNKFLDTYHWDDLRPVNIGVNSQGNPVIFDWMSPQ